MKLQQTVSHTNSLLLGHSVQSLLVARPKLVEVMTGVGRGLLYLIYSPCVIGHILLML